MNIVLFQFATGLTLFKYDGEECSQSSMEPLWRALFNDVFTRNCSELYRSLATRSSNHSHVHFIAHFHCHIICHICMFSYINCHYYIIIFVHYILCIPILPPRSTLASSQTIYIDYLLIFPLSFILHVAARALCSNQYYYNIFK